MGTTVVALLARAAAPASRTSATAAPTGCASRRIRQLTDDHSIVGELLRRHEISADDAREHPHRHVLTRALGVRGHVQPDLAELDARGRRFFVLCSDGLTNHVEDQEIAKLALESPDLDECCEALIELANHRGGEDNTTVVLARFEEE